jgi:hypothetical protein
MPTWEALFLNLVTQLPITLVAAFLAAWFALRRFQSERWWERRVPAYTSIIDALHQMSTSFDDDIKEEERRGLGLVGQGTASTLDEKYKAARKEILRAIDMGEFIISAEAVAELRHLIRELAKDHEDYLDYLFESLRAIDDSLRRFRRLARDDVKRGIGSYLRRGGRCVVRIKDALMSKRE